jgi:membrane protein YdbS with pleckstrin-like domain
MSTLSTPTHQLDPRVKTAWRLQALASAALPLVGAIIFLPVAGTVDVPAAVPWLVLVIVLGVIALTVGVIPEIRYQRWRWEVREEEIRLREGLIIVTQTVIPMVRVQHVDTAQGPIMRALGLSDVHVWTAASKHTVPALSDEHAADLRDRIATLARVTDDGGL